MQSHDEEIFNKVDFDESGAGFADTVVEESDTEEAHEGTGDSTYETEEEPTTETESEDEGHLNTSQYKRLVWPVLHKQFMSETLWLYRKVWVYTYFYIQLIRKHKNDLQK